jgi:hypothetical protein
MDEEACFQQTPINDSDRTRNGLPGKKEVKHKALRQEIPGAIQTKLAFEG